MFFEGLKRRIYLLEYFTRHNELLKWGARFYLCAWFIIYIAAIAGMYHLWWTREHRLYANKNIFEQRTEVFKRAGLPPAFLIDVDVIESSWPQYINYKIKGDLNQVSYVKYLLIPRIPSGSDDWIIREKAGRLFPTNTVDLRQEKRIHYPPNPWGMLISMLLLSGVASLSKRLNYFSSLNMPEGLAIALLLLTFSTMLSRGISGDSRYGFWVISAMGIFGVVTIIFRIIIKGHGLKHFNLPDAEALTQGIIQSRTIVIFMVAMTVLMFIWCMLMSVIVVPDDWDAWAIWGAKAKVLALGIGSLKDVTLFPHADYPLLWPSLWAFTGWCAGGWEEHWSRGWGPILMVLSAWEMSIVVKRLTGKVIHGMFVIVFFLSMPLVPLIASWSFAEAPLWLMFSCSFGRLLLWHKEKEDRHLLVAAVFAAAAAYTKNEGLLFAFISILWLILISPKKWRFILGFYALPISILYVPWLLWVRVELSLGSHAFNGFYGGVSALVRAFDRLPIALKSISTLWIDIRQWNVTLWAVLIISIVHLIRARGYRMDLFVPLIMLLSFIIINVFHTTAIGSVGSWNRLTVQTLPLFIMVLSAHYLPLSDRKDST